MAGNDRARRVRGFAGELESQHGTHFGVAYDSGPTWTLSWVDGPGYATVRKAVDAADLAGAKLRLFRSRSVTSIVLTAIRMAAAGRLGRSSGGSFRSGPLSLVESEVDDTDFPDRPDDDLQAALAERLLALATATSQSAWAEYQNRPRQGFALADVPMGVAGTVASLIRDRGLGWLVQEAAQAGVDLPPLTLLSVRYASRADAVQAVAWRERAQPLPVQAAVAAALADEQLTTETAIALIALLPDLRVEQAIRETAAIEAARHAGVAPEQIDAVLDGHPGHADPAEGR
ncbi:hypothetical protein AB0B10_25185 [Micromonospora arborensis]|uniref:hypothetical protein n=1 Tax=Micromonospora arborensis TaxID=2116518 RepID=UPI0033D46F51